MLSFLPFVLGFLPVITVVVFVHELGHYLVGRWCGVRIERFSIGFGHEVFGFTDRRGMRWSFSAIPLGGYVKFAGDENAASVPTEAQARKQADLPRDPDMLQFRPTWERAAVIAAGPIASLLLAVVIFSGLGMAYGVRTTAPLIGGVVDGSPAEQAGFKAGDIVKSINGRAVTNFGEIPRIVTTSGGSDMVFVVARGVGDATIKVAARLVRVKDEEFQQSHDVWQVGLKPANRADMVVKTDTLGVLGALRYGVEQTAFVATATGSYIRDVLKLRVNPDQIGGVVRMIDVSGKVAKRSALDLIPLAALISASVGLMNLLPFLPLDGGHLLNHAYEALRGRPMSLRSQEMQAMVGLSFVAAMMALAFYNDLSILQRWVFG